MKYLLLFSISLFSLGCFAQSDTADFKHRHRVWINPTQVIIGQYTLAYGLRFYRNNWIEAGGGYRYIPNSIVRNLPGAPQNKLFEIFANPKHGIGFTGPVAMVTFIHYYHGQYYNGAVIELFYQHLDHPPDCYYEPGNESFDHYTYSSTKDNYGAKFFLLNTLASNHHLICQWYVGGGLRLGYGVKTLYEYDSHWYGQDHRCVADIHDPDVITSQSTFHYVTISVNIGIKLGFQ